MPLSHVTGMMEPVGRLGRHRGELSQELRPVARDEWGPAFRHVFTTRRPLRRVLTVAGLCLVATLLVTVVFGADFAWIGPAIAGALGVTIGTEVKAAAGQDRRRRQAE